ncbi:hypothetical protein RSAG8_10266, partial [Rhizoctonia solani AG-8 WAC10335]
MMHMLLPYGRHTIRHTSIPFDTFTSIILCQRNLFLTSTAAIILTDTYPLLPSNLGLTHEALGLSNSAFLSSPGLGGLSADPLLPETSIKLYPTSPIFVPTMPDEPNHYSTTDILLVLYTSQGVTRSTHVGRTLEPISPGDMQPAIASRFAPTWRCSRTIRPALFLEYDIACECGKRLYQKRDPHSVPLPVYNSTCCRCPYTIPGGASPGCNSAPPTMWPPLFSTQNLPMNEDQ